MVRIRLRRGQATRLKAYLEKNYLDVRPLNFPAEMPTVPADADLVVVADPQSALAEPVVAALRAFMNNPAKKGKLIVLVSAHAGPDRKMIKTGLEPLLAELNVQLGSKFVYNLPNQFLPRVDRVLAGFSRSAERNPILQAIVKVSPVITFGTPREVETNKNNPAFTATDLMLSDGRTWTEDEPIADIRAVVEPMMQSVPAQRARGVTNAPRSLAVTISEGETARAAVFGNSYFVSDEVFRQARSGVGAALLRPLRGDGGLAARSALHRRRGDRGEALHAVPVPPTGQRGHDAASLSAAGARVPDRARPGRGCVGDPAALIQLAATDYRPSRLTAMNFRLTAILLGSILFVGVALLIYTFSGEGDAVSSDALMEELAALKPEDIDIVELEREDGARLKLVRSSKDGWEVEWDAQTTSARSNTSRHWPMPARSTNWSRACSGPSRPPTRN